MARHQKLTFLVVYVGDGARNRRSIDMDVKDIEKNAHSGFVRTELADGDNTAVSRRNEHIRGWGGAIGIAEEVETKSR